jgi:hypothetical protein
MKYKIVKAVDAARREILEAGLEKDRKSIADCIIRNLSPYSENLHVRAMLEEAKRGSIASGTLLDLTYSDDPDFILGFFEVPYNQSAFLEAAAVERVEIPKQVLRLTPTSEALPVTVRACTEGLSNPLAVAVFAEHYVEAELKEHHKAYYFIDKFVDRFKRYTIPTIRRFWDTAMFDQMLEADDETLYRMAAIWVWMHEYYHRKGYLPIPKYLKEKSTRNGGGAEELRADMLSILALSGIPDPDPIIYQTIQYILAERLIRYPLQATPQENYDARSSVALFSYLSRHGVLTQADGRMIFDDGMPKLLRAIRSLSCRLSALEYRLLNDPARDKKATLRNVLPELACNGDTWEMPGIYRTARAEFA